MPHFTCHLSHVTYHQRQQSQPQPQTLLTPTPCTVGWFPKTEPKKPKIMSKRIFSNTLFDQMSPVHQKAGFPEGDDIPRTSQLIDLIGLGTDSGAKKILFFFFLFSVWPTHKEF